MSCFANFSFCSANSISALPLLKRGSKCSALEIFSLSLSCARIWISIIAVVCLQLKPNCRIIFEEAVISFVYFFEYFLRKFDFIFLLCLSIVVRLAKSFFFLC